MKYGYYPGCSLEKNAACIPPIRYGGCRPFEIEFVEVPDWNCCGATEYFSVDALPAYALVSRNLAIAAKNDKQRSTGCPLQRMLPQPKENRSLYGRIPKLSAQVNEALEAGGLSYEPGSSGSTASTGYLCQ